jgi:3-oxoadipate enol-lactonase
MLPHDEHGAGPAIVLLHAGVGDRGMWSEHMEPLAAAGYRVIAFDHPGFGEAAVSAGEDAPWVDVLAAIDELGIERAALVGNSFGGAVALRIAVLAPARAQSLVLVSAPAGARAVARARARVGARGGGDGAR